jgi:plastocyanin
MLRVGGRVASGAIAMALALAACGGGSPAASTGDGGNGGAATVEPDPGDVVIVVRDFEFVPSTVSVPLGTRIVIRNEGSTQHSLIADDVTLNTDPIDPGEEAVIWAGEAGVYPFHCELHPQMKGTLTFEE